MILQSFILFDVKHVEDTSFPQIIFPWSQQTMYQILTLLSLHKQ